MVDEEGSPERATPLSETLLAGESDKGVSIDQLYDDRLIRYAKAKKRSTDMVAHIDMELQKETIPGLSPSVLPALRVCGDFLRFQYYYQKDLARLAGANFCHVHLLCPLCAIRRGARLLRVALDKWQIILAEQPDFNLWLVTLTVKNGFDLQERFHHLQSNYTSLVELRQKQRKRNSLHCEFGKIEGALTSFETTWSDEYGYHPHAHMICALNKGVSILPEVLSQEWLNITGDSFIVDARPVYGDPIGSFCEVTKYAVKTNDMTLEKQFQTYLALKGKNLFRSFGCFYGLEIPEDLNDVNEMAKDEPYIEIIFRYFKGVGYQATEVRKDVMQQQCVCDDLRKQKAKERDSFLDKYGLGF
jgi:hypothetical protein